MICFSKDQQILIVANKMATAIEILSRIKLAFELLPKWMKPGIKEWNKSKIVLSNDCKVETSPTTADGARSRSGNILLLDEAAFISKHIADEMWTSVYPIVSSFEDSKVLMISTPNGAGNLFYTTYHNGLNNKSDEEGENWTSYRIDWWDVPGRDEAWKRKQLVSFNYDTKKFQQEFGNCGSKDTLVTVLDKQTGKQKSVTLKELYKLLENSS
jgi:hypothetical protein